MTDLERGKKIFAALVTRVKPGELDEAMWFNACGLGPIEAAWDEFEDIFEKIFGMTWKEAEAEAKKYFEK